VTRQVQGRPPATSHAAIEAAAFGLFEARGFEATTMDDIAVAVGVGRRTLFRYYPSKNDILWGQFDDGLREFRRTLRELPTDRGLLDVVRDAIIAFNSFDVAALPQHRRRMRLLLGTPALMAHSELRYAAWRSVVAEYVAERLELRPDDLLPVLAGRLALAIAITAYERWLAEDGTNLAALIDEAAQGLRSLIPAEQGGELADHATR
jgi:TetR/AcrR family transcriptional regulator, regulator of mycofactocin system